MQIEALLQQKPPSLSLFSQKEYKTLSLLEKTLANTIVKNPMITE